MLYHFKICCLDLKKMKRIAYGYLNTCWMDIYICEIWVLWFLLWSIIGNFWSIWCRWLNMIRFGFSYIIWGFKFCLACQWVVELLSMYHLSFRFTACVDGSDFSSLIIMEFLTCRTFGVIVNLASWNFSHNEELKEREHIYIKLQC